jgi:flagellar assembly protein FliH
MSTPSREPDIARWDLPSVSGKSVQARRPGRTVNELEEVEKRAYEEAFAKGREAGLAKAKQETQAGLEQLKAQVASLERTVGLLAQPLQQMDAEVEQQLAGLALIIARQLVRRELQLDPAQVIAVIRETVALLPVATRDVRVHLHPLDAAVVRERLAMPAMDRAWSVVEDPVMTRGGCRVTTDTACIDARLETRINAVAVAILGEERAAERGAAAQDPA